MHVAAVKAREHRPWTGSQEGTRKAAASCILYNHRGAPAGRRLFLSPTHGVIFRYGPGLCSKSDGGSIMRPVKPQLSFPVSVAFSKSSYSVSNCQKGEASSICLSNAGNGLPKDHFFMVSTNCGTSRAMDHDISPRRSLFSPKPCSSMAAFPGDLCLLH